MVTFAKIGCSKINFSFRIASFSFGNLFMCDISEYNWRLSGIMGNMEYVILFFANLLTTTTNIALSYHIGLYIVGADIRLT